MTLQVASVRGHHFLAGRLAPPAVVVDLGAHRGEFSAELSRRFGCRCVAVEPVAELIAQAARDARILVRTEAIAPSDGPVVLHLKQNPEASSLLGTAPGAGAGDRTVPGTSWSTLKQRAGFGPVALLKLDVEGGEIELLRSLTPAQLRDIEQITVEFHPDVTGLDAVRDVVARLEAHGFWAVRFARGYGDVLFVNQAVFALGLATRLWLRYGLRNWLGLGRIARRWAGQAP